MANDKDNFVELLASSHNVSVEKAEMALKDLRDSGFVNDADLRCLRFMDSADKLFSLMKNDFVRDDSGAVLLLGGDSDAKCDIVKKIAEKMELNLVYLNVSKMSATDFSVRYDVFKNKEYPLWVQGIIDVYEKQKKKSIVFFDDVNFADPQTIKAFSFFVDSRQIGPYKVDILSTNLRIVASCNARKNQKSSEMGRALIYKFFPTYCCSLFKIEDNEKADSDLNE